MVYGAASFSLLAQGIILTLLVSMLCMMPLKIMLIVCFGNWLVVVQVFLSSVVYYLRILILQWLPGIQTTYNLCIDCALFLWKRSFLLAIIRLLGKGGTAARVVSARMVEGVAYY